MVSERAPTIVRLAGQLGRASGRLSVKLVRVGARALCVPWIQGAGYLCLLMACATAGPIVKATERVLGDDSTRVEAWAEVRYAPVITRVTLLILAVTVLTGAALGASAGILVRLRALLQGKVPRHAWQRALTSAAVLALGHAGLYLRSMAEMPQLYVAAWYDQGGWRRTIQVACTDWLGPTAISATALGLLGLFLFGLPWRWPGNVRRGYQALRGMLSSWRGRAAAIGVLILLLGLALGRRAPRFVRDPARPNVLIIALDGFRYDRLVARTAPELSRLADGGTRFRNAYVTIARTFPAWVTLLTGREPYRHGIRTMLPRAEQRAKDFDALPARLARAGWRTSVVSDYGGDVFPAIDLGFSRTVAPHWNMKILVRMHAWQRATPLMWLLQTRFGRWLVPEMRELNNGADPELIARDAIDVLRETCDEPFFMTVFFTGSHFPYAAPAPYFHRYARKDYRGRYKYDKEVWVEHGQTLAPAEQEHIRGLYDGTVAAADAAAGLLLAELRRNRLLDSTIVVILADHGEDLFEAGRWHGHGDHLYGDRQNHIPLAIVDPRQPGSTQDDSLVRDVDVAPTLYALTGVTPPADLDGRPLPLDGAPIEARPAFSETGLWVGQPLGISPSLRFPYPALVDAAEVDPSRDDEVVLKRAVVPIVNFAKHRSVRDGRWQLVYLPLAQEVRWQLFDATADPNDLHDVIADHPREAERLRDVLWRWMLSDPAVEERRGYAAPRGVKVLPGE